MTMLILLTRIVLLVIELLSWTRAALVSLGASVSEVKFVLCCDLKKQIILQPISQQV